MNTDDDLARENDSLRERISALSAASLRVGATGDDNGGVGDNSRVYFTADADGTYYIAAAGGAVGRLRPQLAHDPHDRLS